MGYITAREAADEYGLHINSVYRILRSLDYPEVRREGRAVYVSTRYLNTLYGSKKEPQPSVYTSEQPSEHSEHSNEQGQTVSRDLFERIVGSLERQLAQHGSLIEKLSDQLTQKGDMIDQLIALNARIALRMGSEPTYDKVEISEAQDLSEEETGTEFTYTDWLRKSR